MNNDTSLKEYYLNLQSLYNKIFYQYNSSKQ